MTRRSPGTHQRSPAANQQAVRLFFGNSQGGAGRLFSFHVFRHSRFLVSLEIHDVWLESAMRPVPDGPIEILNHPAPRQHIAQHRSVWLTPQFHLRKNLADCGKRHSASLSEELESLSSSRWS